MAEEGTLGLARAHDRVGDNGGEEYSKEELQRRMDEARDSITQTVTEIKDSVVHQYESVRETISETLDWREHFKKQPLAWSLTAVGAGFVAGYSVAAIIKGPDDGNNRNNHYPLPYDRSVPSPLPSPRSYIAQPVVGTTAADKAQPNNPENEEGGPGLLQRFQETAAYDRLRSEASTVGNRLVSEASQTAQTILVPAAVGLLRGWLEGLVSKVGPNQAADKNETAQGYRYPPVQNQSQR